MVLKRRPTSQRTHWAPNPAGGHSAGPECVIGTDITSSWQSPHTGALTYGVGTVMVGKAKWKPSELSPHRQMVNQKQYFVSGGLPRRGHHQRLERWRSGDSHSARLCGLREDRWTMENGSGLSLSLDQVVSLMQLLFRMWFHGWSTLTHPLVPGTLLLIWRTPFFSTPVHEAHRKELLSAGKASNVPSPSCHRGPSALRPYSTI